MTDTQQRAAAKAFAKNWKDRGYEKGDSQIFWVELLTTVFGGIHYEKDYNRNALHCAGSSLCRMRKRRRYIKSGN